MLHRPLQSIAMPAAVGLAGLLLHGCLAAPEDSGRSARPALSARAAAAKVCLADEPLPRISATASSSESGALLPGQAIDGNPATRWSSAFSDPQWIRVDLGAPRHINKVVLRWEKASSYRYDLQVSPDGIAWKGIKSVNYNAPGPNATTYTGLNAKGRYLRLYSYQRTTEWGVSLFEIELTGDPDGSCTQPSSVRIDAVHSGKALDVDAWSKADGATILQWPWHGGNNQRWILSSPMQDGKYEIRSLHSGKCLDVEGRSTADGARIQQWACHYGANQRFSLVPAGNGYHRLVAEHSGKCVDVSGGSPADGARLVQWPCHQGDNQKFAVKDPQDHKTDPLNCGRAGHSCLGGPCNDGVCQAAVVANDFSCAVSMAADDRNFWVGDNGGLYRYDWNGYNKTAILTGTEFYRDLIRNGSQIFYSGNEATWRLEEGAASPVRLYAPSANQLTLTGSTLAGYDYHDTRFVSVDRNGTGAFQTVHSNPGEYPMGSAATATHLYYIHGTADGTSLYQVHRTSGTKVRVNDGTESIFGISSHGNTVYWNYRTRAGVTGIRRLSSTAGSAVQEAVTPVPDGKSMGIPLVDGSGIYHTYYDGTQNWFWRTSHTDPADRVLVSNGGYLPYTNVGAHFTADAIVWLNGCSRGGPGQVFRLAKP